MLRLKHRSFRTEEAYIGWVTRFMLFHDTRHPKDRGAAEIRAFLASLATHEHVAASTPHGALNALLLLSRSVLQQPLPHLEHIERPCAQSHILPVQPCQCGHAHACVHSRA